VFYQAAHVLVKYICFVYTTLRMSVYYAFIHSPVSATPVINKQHILKVGGIHCSGETD